MSKCIFLTILSVCAVSDVKEHRIFNGCLFPGVAAGLVCIVWEACIVGGWPAGFLAGAGFLGRLVLAGILGFPFFIFRMIGAGDIKLMAVITAFLGFCHGGLAVCMGLGLGAVLALGRMLHQDGICQRFMYLRAYIRRVFQNRRIEAYYLPQRDGYQWVIPLGACFCAGGLAMVLRMR